MKSIKSHLTASVLTIMLLSSLAWVAIADDTNGAPPPPGNMQGQDWQNFMQNHPNFAKNHPQAYQYMQNHPQAADRRMDRMQERQWGKQHPGWAQNHPGQARFDMRHPEMAEDRSQFMQNHPGAQQWAANRGQGPSGNGPRGRFAGGPGFRRR